MKAVVVGGGVAGPATALALGQVGIDAVVLEARATDPSAGSYLTLAPNGVYALDVLGALDAVRPLALSSRTNRMYGAGGRHLGSMSLGRPLGDGTVALTLKRSHLATRLAELARERGVEVRYGAQVVDVRPLPDGAAVRLADGSTLKGDLLVGADGVHSRVRRAIDQAAPDERYVGLTNFGGITHGTALAAELPAEAWHFVFGRRAFFGAHPTPDGDVVWFVNVPRPAISREERAATSHDAWKRLLIDLLAEDAGPGQELVSSGTLELAGDNTYDLGHVPHWHRGRMVLLGDAAHAPSPSSGQGASLALEDAVELAHVLTNSRAAFDLGAALAAFEQGRRPRVERVVRAGARSSSAKIPGPVGRAVRDTALQIAFRWFVTDRSTAWMSDHRVVRPGSSADQPR
jgi:2-polyprenyl-6-methoxyphenol hydroxylase-like FAD-dependent oxidoreductase